MYFTGFTNRAVENMYIYFLLKSQHHYHPRPSFCYSVNFQFPVAADFVVVVPVAVVVSGHPSSYVSSFGALQYVFYSIVLVWQLVKTAWVNIEIVKKAVYFQKNKM